MLKPPFKLASALDASADTSPASACCAEHMPGDDAPPGGRIRLADLDPHLHCSVIGTCLTTGELRKLMARFVFVRDSSDLDVHHEAVRFAGQGGAIAKALHKTLDQRHAAVIQRFAKAREPQALAALWSDALRLGEVPGAYWAVLTHREITPALRQQAFGDVHMLSHLVGAANRADIRRLVALERENAEMRDRLERQQVRTQELLDERERTLAQQRDELAAAQAERDAARAQAARAAQTMADGDMPPVTARIALHTQRRERAEQAADIAENEAARLREELITLEQHAHALNRELAAAEAQLRELGDPRHDDSGSAPRALAAPLRGRRLFYVGGRPSSTPAIRDLVLRHGGEFQHHDGGFEDRKGLLASGVAWAQLVVFPVDCVDHDSAGNLKRLCQRQQVAFVALRNASVASFAAAIAQLAQGDDNDGRPGPSACLKHG